MQPKTNSYVIHKGLKHSKFLAGGRGGLGSVLIGSRSKKLPMFSY